MGVRKFYCSGLDLSACNYPDSKTEVPPPTTSPLAALDLTGQIPLTRPLTPAGKAWVGTGEATHLKPMFRGREDATRVPRKGERLDATH